MRVAESASGEAADEASRANASAINAGALRANGASETAMHALDGAPVEQLRKSLGVPALHLFASVSSTLDVAHRLGAAGAAHGTLISADAQTAGRGRGGKSWASPPGAGLWMTILARPARAVIPPVLTVRLGLAAARALDGLAPAAIGIKWPNDLLLGARKLAGVLVEARWRGTQPEWLAIGLGINVTLPGDGVRGAALGPDVERLAVLRALVPALLAALGRPAGTLDASELADYAERDRFRGSACVEPVNGVIRGIDSDAALLVETPDGLVAVATGSLVIQEDS